MVVNVSLKLGQRDLTRCYSDCSNEHALGGVKFSVFGMDTEGVGIYRVNFKLHKTCCYAFNDLGRRTDTILFIKRASLGGCDAVRGEGVTRKRMEWLLPTEEIYF
jgi:hypothetical protein